MDFHLAGKLIVINSFPNKSWEKCLCFSSMRYELHSLIGILAHKLSNRGLHFHHSNHPCFCFFFCLFLSKRKSKILLLLFISIGLLFFFLFIFCFFPQEFSSLFVFFHKSFLLYSLFSSNFFSLPFVFFHNCFFSQHLSSLIYF